MKNLESYISDIILDETFIESSSRISIEDITENSEYFQIDESLGRTTQRKLLSKYNIIRELTLNPSKIRKSFR